MHILPEEIGLQVLSYLKSKDLKSVALVSPKLCRLASTLLWRCIWIHDDNTTELQDALQQYPVPYNDKIAVSITPSNVSDFLQVYPSLPVACIRVAIIEVDNWIETLLHALHEISHNLQRLDLHIATLVHRDMSHIAQRLLELTRGVPKRIDAMISRREFTTGKFDFQDATILAIRQLSVNNRPHEADQEQNEDAFMFPEKVHTVNLYGEAFSASKMKQLFSNCFQLKKLELYWNPSEDLNLSKWIPPTVTMLTLKDISSDPRPPPSLQSCSIAKTPPMEIGSVTDLSLGSNYGHLLSNLYFPNVKTLSLKNYRHEQVDFRPDVVDAYTIYLQNLKAALVPYPQYHADTATTASLAVSLSNFPVEFISKLVDYIPNIGSLYIAKPRLSQDRTSRILDAMQKITRLSIKTTIQDTV